MLGSEKGRFYQIFLKFIQEARTNSAKKGDITNQRKKTHSHYTSLNINSKDKIRSIFIDRNKTASGGNFAAFEESLRELNRSI